MKKLLSIALLTGGLLFSGCGDSENFVFTNNNPVQVAPVCQDDAYTTNQNAVLTVNAANGVLANDEPNGGTLTFAATSAQGGTITGNADGSFVFTPAADFNGPDSFTYTLANNAGQVTCTVNITVISTNGYFVDSVNGSDANGSFTNGIPYQTIQAAVTDAPTGADIIVRPGNYTGLVTLKDGQRLLGSGSTLVNAQGGTRPVLTGPVDLADGNTVDFLRIANSADDGVNGDGQEGGTITFCEIDRPADLGVSAIDVTGNWNISNNTISEAGPMTVIGLGINFTTTDAPPNPTTPTARVRINGNEITDCSNAAIGFTSEMTSECEAQVHDNVMTGNQSGATLEVLATETAVFCLDLENNQNDDVYRFGIVTGAVVNVEELVLNPTPSIPSNTGTVNIVTGGGFTDPVPQMDGFCGF